MVKSCYSYPRVRSSTKLDDVYILITILPTCSTTTNISTIPRKRCSWYCQSLMRRERSVLDRGSSSLSLSAPLSFLFEHHDEQLKSHGFTEVAKPSSNVPARVRALLRESPRLFSASSTSTFSFRTVAKTKSNPTHC